MVVYIYGLLVDMDFLLVLVKEYNLVVIEDVVEVLGQFYRKCVCGSLGDISIFSFYFNKYVIMGEGGMIFIDSEELVVRCCSLRD